MSMYNTQLPRISIVSPGTAHGEQREMELGQSGVWGEAEFFARWLGYRISIAEWDGKCYRQTQYLLPEDYQ